MGRASRMAHRVWRRMPRKARQQLLLRATALAAPKPDILAERQPPLFIAGFLRAASGLGQCARLFHDAYREAGTEVYGIDLSNLFRQGTEAADFPFRDGRGHRGAGTLMLHVSGPFVPLALAALGRGFLRGKWRIGYWAWELPDLPDEWRRGRAYLHEIWAISAFSAAAFERSLQGSMGVVPPPVPAVADRRDGTGEYRRRTGAEFVVLTVFNMASSFARKNPLAAISAFKAAFGDDPSTLLVVKVAHAHTFPEGLARLEDACRGQRNIVLALETCSDDALLDLVAGADVVLSLHRSEGFGLILAHAMHLGRAIVATDWSANREFLTPDNACLVQADLVTACDRQGTYDYRQSVWAEPRVAEAADYLRRLREEPALAAALGQRARQDALAFFSRALPSLAAGTA
jgi:glycosyltransferase involved in cell wall biosynthesis